jgi:hypothetical protein
MKLDIHIYNMSKLKSEKIQWTSTACEKRASDFLFNLSVN